MAAYDHRVDAGLGTRSVRTATDNSNVKKGTASHHRARSDRELADGETRCIVHAEDRIAREIIEHSFAHHRLGTAEALFCRLEDEMDRPIESTCLSEIAGCTEQHRGVAVMTASMHASIIPRAMLKGVGLLDRQRVHIGPQAHRARRIANPQPADDTRLADLAVDLAAEFVKLGGD